MAAAQHRFLDCQRLLQILPRRRVVALVIHDQTSRMQQIGLVAITISYAHVKQLTDMFKKRPGR